MDITIDPKADCTATLTATAPASEVAAKRQAIVSSYQSRANLPGFRPGKVPAATIEKRFGKAVNEELLSELFNQACNEALEKNSSLKVLNFGKPEADIEKDGSYKATATMTIVPDFDLPEYKGIEVEVGSEEITEEDLAKAMNDLAERMADYTAVDRASTKGDIAIIDFTSSLDGKPVAEVIGKPAGFIEGRNDQWMPLEEDSFLPGLADGLIGMKAGESKDIEVSMPADFPIADLQGKKVVFHVTVKEIRERSIPEINAELAERIMPGKSVEEIREMMKGELERRKKTEIDNQKADQITEKLADMLDFALPEALIESETQGIVQRKMQELIYSGTPQDDLAGKLDEIRENAKTEAVRNLKVYFMLQEIANKENMIISEQELAREVMMQAQRSKKNPKSYIRELHREGRMHGIRTSLLTAKVLDFLVKEAKVNTSAK